MNKDVKLSTFGHELMMLYGRVNLSQGEFATAVGISPSALRRWESDTSCPKAESLKRAIETLLSKGAFSQGEEQVEAMHLWELANKRGLRVPFDEAWFRGVMQNQVSVGEDRIGERHRTGVDVPQTGAVGTGLAPVPTAPVRVPTRSGAGQGEEENLTVSPSSDGGNTHLTTCKTNLQTKKEAIGTAHLALPPAKTRGKRKRLLFLLVALAILTIIGSAGTLFFYAREQASKTAADPAYPGYLSGHGTLAFFDPLSQEGGSKWISRTGSDSACQFSNGAYHVNIHVSSYFASCSVQKVFSNFAFEVQLTITQGDCGGMTFRGDQAMHFYNFAICKNGIYSVWKGVDPSYIAFLSTDSSSTIHTGLGHENKIAVVASGSTMTFYVNGQQINHIQDSSYASGSVALIAYPKDRNATDVAFSNARLWTL